MSTRIRSAVTSFSSLSYRLGKKRSYSGDGKEWSSGAGSCNSMKAASNGNGWRERVGRRGERQHEHGTTATETDRGSEATIRGGVRDACSRAGPSCCQLERPFCPLLTRSVSPSTATLSLRVGVPLRPFPTTTADPVRSVRV